MDTRVSLYPLFMMGRITGEGSDVASVNVSGSMMLAAQHSGSISTGVVVGGQLSTSVFDPEVGDSMLTFLSIIGDGDTAEWTGKPEDGTDDWLCISPGVTPPDRSHWIRAGAEGVFSKFTITNVPSDLEIINYFRVYLDFYGAPTTKTPGVRIGIYLDDVLFSTLKEIKTVSSSPATVMIEWTGLNLPATMFKNATKRELWITSIDGGGKSSPEEPTFQQSS